MRDIILHIPEHIASGIAAAQPFRIAKHYRRIIVAGMGGSGIPAEILAAANPAILPWHDFELPHDATADDLLVCVSWSGATAETLSACKKGRELGLDTAVITKKESPLGSLAKELSLLLVVLPAGTDGNVAPRFAVGYMIGALASTIGMEGQLPKHLDPAGLESEGRIIAEHIGAKTPLIYVTPAVKSLGPLWEILFNENAKIHAFWNVFPELTHHELAGFNERDRTVYFPIIIRDDQESAQTLASVDAALALFEKLGYNAHTVNVSRGTLVEKVLNGYILGLWASFSLAERLHVNPEDTEMIESFKRLRKQFGQ